MAAKLQKEPEHYLDQGRWGIFSTLTRHKNGSYSHQESYSLRLLPEILEALQDLHEHDVWITQAAFKKFNRRKANLAFIGVCWADIDYYKFPKWVGLNPVDFLFEYIFPLLKKYNIPFPSLAVDSGQGLQLKWFIDNLPARALPRWDRLQTELCRLMSKLGADANAKDASRVLRLENTFNQKSGRMVRVCWKNIDADLEIERYSFNTLCNAILPFTQDELKAKREYAVRSPLIGSTFDGRRSSNAESSHCSQAVTGA